MEDGSSQTPMVADRRKSASRAMTAHGSGRWPAGLVRLPGPRRVVDRRTRAAPPLADCRSDFQFGIDVRCGVGSVVTVRWQPGCSIHPAVDGREKCPGAPSWGRLVVGAVQGASRTGKRARFWGDEAGAAAGSAALDQVDGHGGKPLTGSAEARTPATGNHRRTICVARRVPRGTTGDLDEKNLTTKPRPGCRAPFGGCAIRRRSWSRMSRQLKPGSKPYRAQLRTRLPGYMIPSRVETVRDLPRLASGKLDRAALPAPPASEGVAPSRDGHARTDTERAIARVWEPACGEGHMGKVIKDFAI